MEMDVLGALHEVLWLEYKDKDYFQAIDYEKISFHCRKCHENGHLIKECPLNKVTWEHKDGKGEKNKEIFTRQKAKQKENRKCQTKASTSQGNMSNAFEALETQTESEDTIKEQETTKISRSTTMPNLKDLEMNPLSIIPQVRETTEGVE